MRSNTLSQKILVFLLSGLMLQPVPVLSVVFAQTGAPIVADGRTQTSVNVNGSITDIRTDTINGANAYNSFSRFNVPGGTTTNLHVPDEARNLVNLVHNERSQIDGILNSYKNGQIGGNVYFLNPHGIIIGKDGVANVGSLTMMTPTREFMNDLISKGGVISSRHERQLFEGNVPLSETGVVSVRGKVRAVDTIAIKANGVNVDSGASLRAGRKVQLDFGDIVNVNGLNTGNEIAVSPEGKIRIVAAKDVNVSGQIAADGIENHKAGNIEIKAGNDINVKAGAEISAKGVGQNSDGGNVTVFADRNSSLSDGAIIDVSVQHGKGGFLEFSAVDTVDIVGNGLRSSSGGTILVDPKTINWTGSGNDVFMNGANLNLVADDSISLNDVYLSTRKIAGTDREANLTGDSTGDSGGIILSALVIELTNTKILSFATGDHNAGGVGFFAYNTEGAQVGAYPGMTWTGTTIDSHTERGRAGDVVIGAISRDMIFDNVSIKNDSSIPTGHGRVLIGDYDKDTFMEGVDVDENNKAPYRGSAGKLRAGGTFSFLDTKFTSGDLYIKGGHPGGSDMTNPVEGKITISKGNIHANRIFLESEEEIAVLGSTLKTQKVYTKADADDIADVFISVMRNDRANIADMAAKRESGIKIDQTSHVEGNDILIQVVVSAGMNLDVNPDGKIVNEIGDILTDEELKALGESNNAVLGIFTDTIPELLAKFEMPALASFRGLDVSASIDIDGTLIAENDIDISSTAAVASNAYDLGIAGIAVNVGVALADSKVTIGKNAKLTSNHGDIAIESVVQNTVTQSTFNTVPVNANPLDVVLGIGVMKGRNTIDIVSGSSLKAENGTIDIKALTTPTAAISATGGRANSYAAFTVGALIEDFETNVSVDGVLNAAAADIRGETYFENNALTVKTMMGDGWMAGGTATFDNYTHVITKIKSGVFSVLGKITGKNFGNPDDLRDFGFGLGTAVMVSLVDTDVTIGGKANITVQNHLNVDALTHNVPVVLASAVANKFKLNASDDKLSQKDKAVEMALPVTVLLQKTNANIESGAKIETGSGSPNSVRLSAKTEVPYNTDWWLADIIEKCTGKSDDFDVASLATWLLSNNLGLDTGFFNSWSQTSVDAESLAVGVMLSAMYMENETLAIIQDNVTIEGNPDLLVSAITDTQMGHVSGNMRSFLKTMPNVTYPNVGSAVGGGAKAKEAFKTSFQSMWGNQGDKGVGAGVMFNWIDNTAKAEIGGATLNVNNLDVLAETKGLDISLSVGASKTEEFGLNGSLGVSAFQANAFAKIDDSAKITAIKDVTINAADRTIIIGVGGNFVVSNEMAFGITGIVPVVIRNVHAVWGNYYGSGDAIASQIVESTVGGTVDIGAEALGVTATLALAGAVTTPATSSEIQDLETQLEELKARRERLKSLMGKGIVNIDAQIQEQQSEIAKTKKSQGTAATGVLAVNILIENIYAGISGNVNIDAAKFDIAAGNKTIDASLGGAGVLQLANDSNKGIAGAIGVNMLFGQTVTFVDLKKPDPNSTSNKRTALIYRDTFDITAMREGYIGSFSGGAAGSVASQGFEIAGSLSVASIQSETLVDIINAAIVKKDDTSAGNMTIDAVNEALLINIAGGVGIGGKDSVGLSIAVSNMTLDTGTSIEDSTITANNLLNTARTESLIVTVALGAGIAPSGKVGLGGTMAFAVSDGDTSVTIDKSTLTLAGDLTVAALSDMFKGTDQTYDDLLKIIQEEEENGATGSDRDNSSHFLADNEKVKIETTDENGTALSETKDVKLGLSARSPRIVTAALAVGGAKEFGVGANIGVNLMTEETYVSIFGSTISAKAVDIGAKTEGGMIAVGVGVAGGGKAGISGNFGVNIVGGRTEVVFDQIITSEKDHPTKITASSGDIEVVAMSTGGIVNAALVVGGGEKAGVGLGFSYNMVAHSVAVDMRNTELNSTEGSVNLFANNASDMISILLSIGGGGKAGVGASLSFNTIGNINLDDADMETPEDIKNDSDAKQEELNAIFDVVGADLPSVIANALNRTEINIYNSTINAKQDVTMDASSTGGMISIALGGGFGGDAGIGLAGAYNNISGGIGVIGSGAKITSTSGSVLSHSQINNAMYSVVIGGGVGGKGGGVALSVSANVLTATNRVDFTSKSEITADSDIVLKSTNSGEMVGSALAFAGGKYFGAASPWMINVLKGKTKINLDDATLTGGDSVVLDAETVNNMYGITAAAALSYITSLDSLVTASIGASVSVNDLMGSTEINIVKSILKADRNILVHTNVDGHLVAVTGSATVAISMGAAVAASTTYNGIHGTSAITVTGSELDALANDYTDFDDLATEYAIKGLSEKFNDRQGIAVGAYSHSDLENYFFLVSVSGGLGANVGVPANEITGKTSIAIDQAKINQNVDYQSSANTVQDVVIESLSKTESRGVVVGLAGGGVAMSAMVDLHLLDSVIETHIKDSKIDAKKNILVGARNKDNSDIYLFGVALGGTGIPINAGGVVQTSKVTITLDGKATDKPDEYSTVLDAGKNLDVFAENKLDIFEVNAALGVGGNLGAGVAFAVNNLEQRTAILVKGTTSLISGDALSIQAKGEIVFKEQIDALGAGMSGLGGAMGIVYAKGLTEIAFEGERTKLKGNSVTVKADDIFTQNRSNVGGFALAMTGAAGGLNVEVLRSNAVVRGYTNIVATEKILVGANVTRDIDTIAIAGSLGLQTGLAGVLNVIDVGAAKGSRDGLTDTADLITKLELKEDPERASSDRNTGVFDKFQKQKTNDKVNETATENQTVALLLGGTLEAPTITLQATVNNTLEINTVGIGVGGLAAAGGAVAHTTVEDNVTAAFAGNATVTNKFTLEGKSTNSVDSQAIAGAGAMFFAPAGAVSVLDFTSNIETILGQYSVIRGPNVDILANQYFKDTNIKTDSGSVALYAGLGGALNDTTLGGDAVVRILDNATIYSGNILLAANKDYKNVKADTLGFAGSLLASGAGMISDLILEGDARVEFAENNIHFWSVEAGNPDAETDKLIVRAVVNVANTESRGEVGTGSLAVAAHGETGLEMNFDTLVDLKGLNFLGGIISLEAYQDLDASALHTTIAAGGVGVAGGKSRLQWNGTNTVKVTDSAFDAWKSIDVVAGKGDSTLDAQTRVFNYTAIPITTSGMTSAKTDVSLDDEIFLENSTLKAVEDVKLRTARENKTLVAYDKIINIYDKMGGASGDFISDREFSLVDSSGAVNNETDSRIDFNKANIEAGSHYDSYVRIKGDGNGGVTVEYPDWISIDVDTGDTNIYDRYLQLINALEEKQELAILLKDQYKVDAYAAEIDQLKQQLSYYLAANADPTIQANYPTVRFVRITDTIRAASGDIFIDTEKITASGSGNHLTAHGDPRIDIFNESNHFLELDGVPLEIPNPLDGGGRIMVNGNILARYAENADALGFVSDNFVLDSLGNDGGQTPFIRIRNTYNGGGGKDPSTELTFRGTQLNNPGGLVDIQSQGNIMMTEGSNINARDVSIVTAGSFFMGYQDGLFNTGGNPLASGTNIAALIRDWIASKMVLAEKTLISTEELEVKLNANLAEYKSLTGKDYKDDKPDDRLKDALSKRDDAIEKYDQALENLKKVASDASWANAQKGDGTIDVSKVMPKNENDDISSQKNDYSSKLATMITQEDAYTKLDYAKSNIEFLQTLKTKLSEDTVTKDDVKTVMASYSDAVTNLQNAVTTQSWRTVFGTSTTGGSNDLEKLVPKDSVQIEGLVATYEYAKGEYERVMSSVVDLWLSSTITEYEDARIKTPSGVDSLAVGYAKSQMNSADLVTELISSELPNNQGTVYGGRSVFISAETLNVNGLIQSGCLDYDIDLSTDAVRKAIGDGKTDLTSVVFNTSDDKHLGILPKVTYENGKIVLGDIMAMGGDITLFGNIISTGNGKLVVADGLGNIKITANPDYELKLGRVDTGLGAEGTIRIIDTSKGNGSDPLTTVYTRVDGKYYVQTDDGSSPVLITDPDESRYVTTSDRWLQTILGSESTLEWKYTYDKDVGYFLWIPGDWMAKDDSYVTDVSGKVTINKTMPVGTFLVTNSELGGEILYGSYQRTAGATNEKLPEKLRVVDKRKVGTGHLHTYYDFTATQSFTEIFTTYLNASQTIGIEFTGNETSTALDISGTKTITLGELVRSMGNASITASAGDVLGAGPNALITAETLNLHAANIGSTNNPLKLESTIRGTVITSSAAGTGTGGLINLQSEGSRLFIDSLFGRDVFISSSGDLLMKSGGSGIRASNDIKATAQAGVIAGVDAQGNPTDRFKMSAGNNITLSASSHILLDHYGDLHVDQISSEGGDLDILVAGNITDANEYEQPDPLSDAETFWKDTGLIEGTDEYNERIARKIDAYEREFTLLYFQAWRDADFEAAGHDVSYQFLFSDTDRANFLAGGMTEAEINAEEQKRTDFYHDAFNAAYKSDYRYSASQEEKGSLTAYTGWTKAQLENAIAMPLFILTGEAGMRNNTTGIIEAPNFSGRNITLTASGFIGSEIGAVQIDAGKSVAQITGNDQWRRALADAEWDDVTFNKTGDVLESISIKRYDDLDIAATGWLKTRSAAGGTYLGSQSDVGIDSVVSGTNGSQSLRFKIDGSLMAYDVNSYLHARDMILEAAGGTLGTHTAPLSLRLSGSGTGKPLTVRGTNGVYLVVDDPSGNPVHAEFREITSRGGIDIYSAGSMRLDFVTARGDYDILLGAESDISIAADALLSSDRDLVLVSNSGNILSEATVDIMAPTIHAQGRVILAAGQGSIFGMSSDQSFLVDLTAKKTHLIGADGINLLNLNLTFGENNPFNLGYLVSGGVAKVGTASNAPLAFDFILAQKLKISSESIDMKSFGKQALIVLSDWLSGPFTPSNRTLLKKPLDISFTGAMEIVNEEEGGTMKIRNLDLRGVDQNLGVDNLVIDSLLVDSSTRLSHYGNDGGLADSTWIGNLQSPGSATLGQLYSRNVSIISGRLGGDLVILDGQIGVDAPGRAALNINGIRTEIDAFNKTKTDLFDFWLWTFNGNYSLVSSQNGIAFPENSAMRALMRSRMNLLLNGDAFYGDTGFGTNLIAWRHFDKNRPHDEHDERIIPLFFLGRNSEDDAISSLQTFDLFGDSPYPQDFRIVPISDEDTELLLENVD